MSAQTNRRLDLNEIESELAKLDGWKVEANKLQKTFAFPSYKDGVVFTSAVAFVADKLDHHPDLLLTYGKVSVSVNTHDVGGLSPLDFELARLIDLL